MLKLKRNILLIGIVPCKAAEFPHKIRLGRQPTDLYWLMTLSPHMGGSISPISPPDPPPPRLQSAVRPMFLKSHLRKGEADTLAV